MMPDAMLEFLFCNKIQYDDDNNEKEMDNETRSKFTEQQNNVAYNVMT